MYTLVGRLKVQWKERGYAQEIIRHIGRYGIYGADMFDISNTE